MSLSLHLRHGRGAEGKTRHSVPFRKNQFAAEKLEHPVSLLLLIGVLPALFLTLTRHSRLAPNPMTRIVPTFPGEDLLWSGNGHEIFTKHGVMLVFLTLVPVVSFILCNKIFSWMTDAKDLATPRLNQVLWSCSIADALLLLSRISDGEETQGAIITPRSTISRLWQKA